MIVAKFRYVGRKHRDAEGKLLPPGAIVEFNELSANLADKFVPLVEGPEPLRTDGPTIEEWVAKGYRAEHYPPEGWAEVPSPGLDRYRTTGSIEERRLEPVVEVPPAPAVEVPPAPAAVAQ